MSGQENATINRSLSSKNNQESFTIQTQKDLVTEFMKILSLAHSCETEFFTDKAGVK